MIQRRDLLQEDMYYWMEQAIVYGDMEYLDDAHQQYARVSLSDESVMKKGLRDQIAYLEFADMVSKVNVKKWVLPGIVSEYEILHGNLNLNKADLDYIDKRASQFFRSMNDKRSSLGLPILEAISR